MPRRNTVEQHPQREAIISAVLNGQAYRDISGQYGVSKSAIGRFVENELDKLFLQARKGDRRDLIDLVIENAMLSAKSLRNLLQACSVVLEDPEEPERYDLVTYSDSVVVAMDDQSNPGAHRRMKLSEVIRSLEEATESSIEVVSVDRQDPARTMISAANTVVRQLAVVSRINQIALHREQDRKTRVSVVESEVWKRMANAIAAALDTCPDARQEMIDTLKAIRLEIEGDFRDRNDGRRRKT